MQAERKRSLSLTDKCIKRPAKPLCNNDRMQGVCDSLVIPLSMICGKTRCGN